MSSRDKLSREGDEGAAGRMDKGKGKQKDSASQRTGQDTGKEDSLISISRIANSTVSLANSLVSGTPSNSVLANAVSEKGSTSAYHAESSASQFRPDIAVPPAAQPFRTSQAQSHAAAEEAAFSDFLDSTPVFQASGSSAQMEDITWHMTGSADRGPTPYSSVAEQERHDGEAVVSLLMDANEHLPDSLEEYVLSPEEQVNLRKALFGQSEGSSRENIDWNHVLNFLPEYLRHDEQSMDAYMDIGSSDPRQAWDSWIGYWRHVLTRYQDEVWGDLGPLVKEAQRELEQLAQVKQDEPPSETPALRRLKAVLAHLRG